MGHDDDKTPEQGKILEKAEEAAKRHAKKLRREHAGRKPDANEPEGVLAGGPEYLDADLDDDEG